MKKFLWILLFAPFFAFSLAITLENGVELYKKKAFKEAYAVFFNLQEKEKKDSYYFYLGNTAHFLGKDDEAENWYQKGTEIFKNLGDDYYFNYGIILIRLEKHEKAIEILEKIKKKNAMAHTILGTLYYNEKNYPKAEAHLKTLMKEAGEMPDDFLVSIYENYFFASLAQKNYYQASNIGNLIKNFKDASPAFWENYGGVLFQTSQLSKASAVFKGFTEKKEMVSEENYFKLLYLTAFKRKNYEEALKWVDKALEKYSKSAQFAKVKAYLYYISEQWEKSWEILDKLPLQNKQDHKNKAWIAYLSGREKEAVKILENAFIIYSDESILANLLSLYLKDRKYQQAELAIRLYQNKKKNDRFFLWLFQIALLEDDMKKAQEYGEKYLASAFEKNHEFYYNLGKVYEKKPNISRAIEFYEKSKKLSPEFPYPYVALANLHVMQKQYQHAEDNYLTAIKLLPDYGIYYYQLAQVYALQENYFLAKELIKQALYRQLPKSIIQDDPLFTPVFKQFPDFNKEFKDF